MSNTFVVLLLSNGQHLIYDGKIIRTAPCCVVYDIRAQWCTCKCEQFLNLWFRHFCAIIVHLVFILFDFVVLGLVFSVPWQRSNGNDIFEIACFVSSRTWNLNLYDLTVLYPRWAGVRDWGTADRRSVWGSPLVELPLLITRLCCMPRCQSCWRSDVWQNYCLYILGHLLYTCLNYIYCFSCFELWHCWLSK